MRQYPVSTVVGSDDMRLARTYPMSRGRIDPGEIAETPRNRPTVEHPFTNGQQGQKGIAW